MIRKIDGGTLSILDNEQNPILTLHVSKTGDTTTIIVSGSITHDAAPEFEDELISCLTVSREVIVDFSSLDHISAPGLNALLTVQKLVDEKRFAFYIKGVSSSVKGIFEQTGFIDLIDIR